MEGQGDGRTVLYTILEGKGEDIFQKGRKVPSPQITKILRTKKKMNGSLVQTIKNSLVRSVNEILEIESILLGLSGSISRKYEALLRSLIIKKSTYL